MLKLKSLFQRAKAKRSIRRLVAGGSSKRSDGRHRYSPLQIARSLYAGVFNRSAEDADLRNIVDQLDRGNSIEGVIESMLDSGEFHSKAIRMVVPEHSLPDLRARFPQYYKTEITAYQEEMLIFNARSKREFNLLEEWISLYRYYDVPGVWGLRIDLDKKLIAAVVQGLGATSCLEVGCFTGAVISLLKTAGIRVVGLDTSHLAFVLAYPNIRDDMIFADLLSAELPQKFDVVLAMDILEHLNPFSLDRYIERIASLLSEDGYLYLNSPMFGTDDVFGSVFPPYLAEWNEVGDSAFWHHLDCDDLGWPKHGHLVWASPLWWERAFEARGLIRDRDIEKAIHRSMGSFFDAAPSRRCLFVLKHRGNAHRPEDVAERVAAGIRGLDEMATR